MVTKKKSTFSENSQNYKNFSLFYIKDSMLFSKSIWSFFIEPYHSNKFIIALKLIKVGSISFD